MQNIVACLTNLVPNLLLIGMVSACTAIKTQPQQSPQLRAVCHEISCYK
jgi:hypothetical protein